MPLIDAAMNELQQTGYCSNRVRQNAASLLTKDLQLDWRAGAEWFQICLADHCVAANTGNWSYFGGTGLDPKHRHFRTVSQAIKYDPDGSYVRKWVPALKDETNPQACFRPWDFRDDWPSPIVDVESQITWMDLKAIRETKEEANAERCHAYVQSEK